MPKVSKQEHGSINTKQARANARVMRYARHPITIVVILLIVIVGAIVAVRAAGERKSVRFSLSGGSISGGASDTGGSVAFGIGTTSWWKPAQNTKWQWVLNGKVTTNELARFDMYDVDLQSMVPAPTTQEVTWANGHKATITWPKGTENPGMIQTLKSNGKKVICYIDTGAFEDYRPDASLFPGKWGAANNRAPSANGGGQDLWGSTVPYAGPPQYASLDVIGGDSEDSSGASFSGEYWLDQREPAWKEVWGPIIWARLDLAKKLGCDGVEGDQNNAYGNDTTFGATQAISLRLYREFYYQAHLRGLTAISKNGIELTAQQVTEPGTAAISYCAPGLCVPDGILNEECQQYNECGDLDPATSKGMWVGQVEYKGTATSVCSGTNGANAKKRMAMKKPVTDPVDERISFACWETP